MCSECPTTSLSLHQCLAGAEKSPRAEGKVPPVDYYYFFCCCSLGWKEKKTKKKHPQLWCSSKSLVLWSSAQCCGTRAGKMWDFFSLKVSPVTIINSNILPKRSSSPETLRGKIHHQSCNPPCTIWFVVHGRANLKPPVEMIIDGLLLGSEAI